MVAVIRYATPPLTAKNSPQQEPPLVLPKLIVRDRVRPEAIKTPKPKVPTMTVGPFTVKQAHYVGWDSRKFFSSLDLIAVTVCDLWEISRQDLFSQRRNKQLTWPRQAGYLLARDYTGASYPNIGRFFGNRDHTTVLHGCREAEKRSDPEFVARLLEARDRIKSVIADHDKK